MEGSDKRGRMNARTGARSEKPEANEAGMSQKTKEISGYDQTIPFH
jgi:hypothetical protein